MEQGTEEWHKARLGQVTASRIADVMMKPSTAGYQNYKAQLICERLTGQPTETFKSAAMQHGTDTEPQARAFYELETGLSVSQVGFIPHPTLAGSGASPDGLVGGLGLVEIKCPQPAEHIRTLMGGEIKRQYVLQMQWQMECTGREWCDFVSFNTDLPFEMQMHRQRVSNEPELCAEIADTVAKFLREVTEAEKELTQKFMEEAA